MLKSRTSNLQSRKIEQVGAKRAVDVWCGGHASFYRNDKGVLFAWGLNNHGQLGIGHKDNVCAPSRVLWANDQEDVVEVAGGEHHTIALTKSGRVYCWGRNDEGECGVGDLFGKYRREQALLEQQKQEEAARMAREEEEKKAAATEEVKVENGNLAVTEGGADSQPAQKSRKSKKVSREPEEPDLAGIYYFSVPNAVISLDGKGVT